MVRTKSPRKAPKAATSSLTKRTPKKRAPSSIRSILSSIVEGAPYGIMVLGEDSRFLYINAEVTRISGYTLDDLPTGRDWMHAAYPDPALRKKVIAAWKKDVQAKKAVDRIFSVVCRSQEVKELEFRVAVMEDGKVVTMFSDVTERVRMERALAESEQRYRKVFETTGTAMVIIQQDYILSWVNAEFTNLSGYTKEELEGKMAWTHFFVEEELARSKLYHHQRRIDPRLAPRSYESRFVDRKQLIKNILITVDMIPGTQQSVASFLDISRLKRAEAELQQAHDELEARVQRRTMELSQANQRLSREISERQKWEQALFESEEKYRHLVEHASDGIYLFHPLSGHVLLANLQLISMLGYAEEELKALTVFDLLDEERAVVERNIKKVLDAGEAVFGPRSYRRKDGTLLDVEINSALIHYLNEEVIMVNVRDIRERKQAEAEREKLISELQEALVKVKTLKGLLPICASCKKIRDDKGYWNQIEIYIAEHSEADFSHSLCPECATKLYAGRGVPKRDSSRGPGRS